MKETLLEMNGICKNFPGVKALDNVQLEVKKGEIHALIGENGAGKSTLMKVLLGIYMPDAGSIRFKGEEVHFKTPTDAINAGISMIHQEISLVPAMSVSENIWLGRENRFKRFGMIDVTARDRATSELLSSLGLAHLNPKEKVRNLSIANMQLVELARAVSYHSDIIIMDEPTSSLTSVEIELLYKIVKKLAEDDVAIIFISHKLNEIFEICERVTVFRDGKYIATKYCKDITINGLMKDIVGRDVKELYPKLPAEIGKTVLEVRDFNRQGVFYDVNFSVRAGEILGFSGLVGAGRSEIMRALFGIDNATSGEVLIDGKPVIIKNTQDAIKYGLGMVTEDRLLTGSIYQLSVMANMTLSNFRRISNKLGIYRPNDEVKAFNSQTNVMNIKYSSPKAKQSSLSGGNQQKVIIARWLMTNPKVLILDEPTRGIDVGAKSEIHRLISQLAQKGLAIILISSELPEVMGISDRIAVVREGRIVHICDREKATQEKLMNYAFGQN